MRGYVEQVDLDKSAITGWVFDQQVTPKESLIVKCKLNGQDIGFARPKGTRQDLFERVSESDNLIFRIQLSNQISAEDLLSQRAVIVVESGPDTQVLSLTSTLTTRLVQIGDASFQPRKLAQISDSSSESTIPHSVNGAKRGLLSSVLLPIGMESADKSARIGGNGHLFLTGGTNGVEALYAQSKTDALRELHDEWISIFEARQKEASNRGIRYLQCVIPEKLTVLSKFAPFPISGPTTLLAELESSSIKNGYYISGIKAFENWNKTDDPFLKSDSHLSSMGAQAMFAEIVGQFNPALKALVESIKIDQSRFDMGDLSRRFFNLPIYCEHIEPDESQILDFTKQLTQTKKHISVTKHIGSWFAWHNAAPSDPRRVVVFGNSFFGPGNLTRELSWWGKLFFSEFHFIWTPNVDWDIVNQLKPDIVIGQTIERFLTILPEQ